MKGGELMFSRHLMDVTIVDRKINSENASVPYSYVIDINGLRGTVRSFKLYEVGDIAPLCVTVYGSYHNLILVIE